jgi:hypothetical protein
LSSAPRPRDVRQRLREAESFLHLGDPYGATARATDAARCAASIHSPDGDDVREETSLVLDRLEAAEEAAREEVRQRHALHIENELRAAGITSEALGPPSQPRRSWIAELVRSARERTRRVELSHREPTS